MHNTLRRLHFIYKDKQEAIKRGVENSPSTHRYMVEEANKKRGGKVSDGNESSKCYNFTYEDAEYCYELNLHGQQRRIALRTGFPFGCQITS
uniref:Uncharacterized protein n=1 Tax=Arundo donax TaxID=35708 RepID=A0A0A9FQX7_ARUDO